MSVRGAELHRSCKIYTPYRLAAVMGGRLEIATSVWLEPCFGRGVFLKALHSAGVPKQRILRWTWTVDRRSMIVWRIPCGV